MNKIRFEIEQNLNGFTVWSIKGKNRHWILDASTILEDGCFSYSSNEFKKHGKSTEIFTELKFKEPFIYERKIK